jgi:hypothetical protein
MGTDLYWIADGGNWNDGGHWSLEDNGESTGAHVPTFEDNVFFTSYSFQSEDQVVTVPSGSFNTGIITADCKNFTLNIVDTLTCNYEWTINNNSIINGRFKLNNVAVWNGNGVVEELYCMPYTIIKGSNTITNLILDTDGNNPSAAFYFDLHTNQTVQTFNIVNTSINSQALIKIQPLLFVTISHSPGSVTTYGEPVTLTWSSTGADMCSIDNDIGLVAVSGSTVVYPMTGTTYTITASGYGLTATDSTSMYALASTYSDNVSYMSVLPVSGSYYIIPPTFSGLSEYTFETDFPKTLTISCAAPIYYTLDGSTPTSASSLYSAPISIVSEYYTGSGIQTLVVKAVGYDSTVGDYSDVATSITYKKVPFGVAIIVNRTDVLVEAIVSEQKGSLVTTAMPVSGSYDEVVILQTDAYTDEVITTAIPVSGSYDEIVIVQEDYTDDPVSMSVLPISGAYWKVIVEG